MAQDAKAPAEEPTLDRLDQLLEKFRLKRISQAERDELKDTLNHLREAPNFKLKEFVTDRGFNEGAYNNLTHTLGRKARPVSPIVKLERQVGRDFEEFLLGWWKSAKETGTTVAQKFGPLAAEMGFFDEETQLPDLVKFVNAACAFFVDYHQRVPELLEENKQLTALSQTFQDLTKPAILRAIAWSSYLEFMSRAMALEVAGIPVPAPLLEEVKLMTLHVFQGGTSG